MFWIAEDISESTGVKNMKNLTFPTIAALFFILTSCQKPVQRDGMTVYPADYAHTAKSDITVPPPNPPADSFDIESKTYFDKGQIAQTRGKYRKAIEFYTECIERDFEFVNASINRGNCYAQLGEFDKALLDFHEALLIERNFFAYYSQGMVYEAKGDNLMALANYNTCIRLGGNFCPALIRRAFVYAALEQFDSALKDINEAMLCDSMNPDIFRIRSDIHSKTHKNEEAIEDLNKAIMLEPGIASDYYNRGNIYLELKDYRSAVKDYSKAISLNSRYAKAYHNRAIAYSHLNYTRKAIQDYLKAATVDKSFAKIPEMWYQLGEIFFHKKKDYRKAIFYYNKAIGRGGGRDVILSAEENPDDVQKYFSSRGDAYYNLKAWKKALQDYNAAYEIAENSGGYLPDILIYRGDTYMQLHDFSKALNDYLEAELIRPFDCNITYRIAACYRILNNFENAEMYLKRARWLEFGNRY